MNDRNDRFRDGDIASQPEILPASRRAPGNELITDEQLDMLATVLDDAFQIPGTKIRFGLDSIIGLIPGIGDLVTGAASMLMIYSAWQRNLPRVTIYRMVANIAADTIVGSFPIVGDLFDVAWKANRKNYELLTRSAAQPSRKQQAGDWLFLIFTILLVAALVSLPILMLVFVIQKIWY